MRKRAVQIRTEGPVTLQLINPDDLPVPSTYTHVVVATGTRMVSGHQDHDLRRSPPARTPAGHRAGQTTPVRRAQASDTVVGVETLAGPGYLIEVDAIAVTDR
jgi:hypothetical protein